MSEIEFHQLKNEQGLLIDFQKFPNLLMQLLELCINQTYICILHKRNQTEAALIIQERNQFQELNHLRLNLKQANDSMLKRYLGALSSEFKSKYESVCQSIEQLKETIAISQKENCQFKEMIQIEKTQSQSAFDNLMNEKNKELNQFKEKCFIDNKSKLDELEQIKNTKIEELDQKIIEIQNKYEEILNEKKQVEEYKLKLELNHKNLEGSHAITSTELNVYKEDITHLRQDNSALNQKCFKQEKEITELIFTTDSLRIQNDEKEKSIINLNQLVETLTKQRGNNDESSKGYKTTIAKLEEKLQTSINEINKGNEIIEKLRTELKAQKSNCKAKQQILTTQEGLTNQKQIMLDEQIRMVNELKRANDNKEMEIVSLNKQIANYQQKLNDNEKLIDKNKEMIMYLNQKLNENYNPFQTPPIQGGSNTNRYSMGTTQIQQSIGLNTGMNINNNYTNDYPLDPLASSNNNDNMNSSTGSGMLIMPETNFCNYKPSSNNNKHTSNLNAMGLETSNNNNINLLNHKYGMMIGGGKTLDNSGSFKSMNDYNNNTIEESNRNTQHQHQQQQQQQRGYNLEEEFPRQMAQPQRLVYQNK